MTNDELEILRAFLNDFAIETEFRVLATIDGMKFKMNSKEQGHNLPHIHLETASTSMVITIEDSPQMLKCSGQGLNNRRLNLAINWVSEHKEMLINNWNELTNGVKVDL